MSKIDSGFSESWIQCLAGGPFIHVKTLAGVDAVPRHIEDIVGDDELYLKCTRQSLIVYSYDR